MGREGIRLGVHLVCAHSPLTRPFFNILGSLDDDAACLRFSQEQLLRRIEN